MAKALSYAEVMLLDEIARALRNDDRDTLALLDRIRDAAGLPQDKRVRECLARQEKAA